MAINLDGFCFIQEEVWLKIKEEVEKNGKCLKCSDSLLMKSKWRAKCISCGTIHGIKKPKSFPKNMNDKSNWKATCDECSGTMDYYENSNGGAYICGKCNNILEV